MASMFRKSIAATLSLGLAASAIGSPVLAAEQNATTVSVSNLLSVPFTVETINGEAWNVDGDWNNFLMTLLMTMDQKEYFVDPAAVAAAIAGVNPDLGWLAQRALSYVTEAKATVDTNGVVIVGKTADLSSLVGDTLAAFFNIASDTSLDLDLQGLDLETEVKIKIDGASGLNNCQIPVSVEVLVGGESYTLTGEKSVYKLIAEKYIALADEVAAMQGADADEQADLDELSALLKGSWAAKLDEALERADALIQKVEERNEVYEGGSLTDVLNTILANVKEDTQVEDILANTYVQNGFTKAVELFNTVLSGDVVLDVTLDDVADLMNSSYDASITVDGSKVIADMCLADDENSNGELADLAADNAVIYNALAAIYADLYGEEMPENAEIIEVSSYKNVLASFDVQYEDVNELLITMNVTRVIDDIVIEVPVETTTTTAETTTTTAETTTTTSETTTTTVVYDYNIVASPSKVIEGGCYWSEDTTPFSIGDVGYYIDLYRNEVSEDGTASQPELFAYAYDVMMDASYFTLDAASPAEVAYTGRGKYAINVCLAQKAVDAIYAYVAETYGGEITPEMLARAGVTEGSVIDTFEVMIGLRGDTTLDEKVNANDAQMTLNYYLYTEIMHEDYYALNEDPTLQDLAFYVSDVMSRDRLDANTAQMILMYYRYNTILGVPTTWDQLLGNDAE